MTGLLETDAPLSSRERSIWRAHSPCCPRIRRLILERSETVQFAIRETEGCFHLHEVPPSRVTKQVIGPRIPRWTMKIGMSFLRMKVKVGFRKISLKRVYSVEPVSELDYCQIGMTAIVMGDVNAVYTLECAHRRQLLAARALNERSLLIRGLPFPRTKTIGDVYVDDLVILSVFAIFKRAS